MLYIPGKYGVAEAGVAVDAYAFGLVLWGVATGTVVPSTLFTPRSHDYGKLGQHPWREVKNQVVSPNNNAVTLQLQLQF